MERVLAAIVLLTVVFGVNAWPHGLGTVTWNKEISRVVYAKCASCHRKGGTSFPLMTFQDAQPRAVEIKEAVLSRRMPPWGAVKGFGDFRNDQGLTQEEIELITDWVEDGTPRGNNPNMLPKEPKFKKPDAVKIPKNAVSVSSDLKLDRPFVLDGLWIDTMPDRAQMQIVASLPDGTIEPLLWLYEYNARFKHAFLLRDPLALPAGTVIRGVLPGASVTLLPGKK